MIDLPIIPRPVSQEPTGGTWRIPDSPQMVVDISGPDQEATLKVARQLLPQWSFVDPPGEDNVSDIDSTLYLSKAHAEHKDESYTLYIEDGSVTIEASGHAGLVWGLQTLRQVLDAGPEIPCLICKDRPRFAWRGMHLDVARHFFPTEFILKFLELLSRHKLNVFHWHLTDDQGWRLPIEAYPRLTEIGGWRTEANGDRYGGYYTGDDISRVVAHARMLGITVVPEIDLPGHATAALAAYPELSCDKKQVSVANTWGVFENTLCPSRESTYEFVETVLSEIAAMFDSEYIHIGGDECPTGNWEKHDTCREIMTDASMSAASELQGRFNERVSQILKSLDRKLLGWDEILETGAPANSTIMCWRDAKYAERAVANSHKVVLSPMSHCYFDFYQAKEGEPKAIGGFLPLEHVYEFDPISSDLLESHADLVLGGQANIWTEYMETQEHVEYMAIPRICALSESLWSASDSRDLYSFMHRLPTHLRALSRSGYSYRGV